jgi:hypothetical protein
VGGWGGEGGAEGDSAGVESQGKKIIYTHARKERKDGMEKK